MRPTTNISPETNSHERQSFAYWLRTGRWVSAGFVERKFNPWHDPRNGQFTFAPGDPRSLADAVFVDRRGLWQARPTRHAPDRAVMNDMGDAYAPSIRSAVLWDEKRPRFQPVNQNSRARIGGNRPPPDPLILEQVFPALRTAPSGAIVAPIENFFDFSGPAHAAVATIHRAQVDLLLTQIRSVRPSYELQSLGGPMTTEAMAIQIRRLRLDRATILYRDRGELRPLQVEVMRIMQERADSAYQEGVYKFNAGQLRPKLSREEAIGNYVDRAVRTELRGTLGFKQIDTSRDRQVRVVGREYDTSGSETSYRIPDARVGRIAFDVTLTRKTSRTDQVRGFFNADFRPEAVIIIRPRQYTPDHIYAIKKPSE